MTDADVALGMIDPDAFAGGTIKLNPELSKQALLRAVGEPLGLSAETAAYAVHEVVCENMASAARVHAVERGEIVGQHTLIAFGGAAPLHAARVAEKIGVSRVIVPSNAGVGSAVGFLAAPIAYELVRSRHVRLDDFDTECGLRSACRRWRPKRARWSSRVRPARRCVNAAPPSCAMSARATRSRSSCRTGG